MNEYIYELDDIIKPLLQSTLTLSIDNVYYKEGIFLSYNHNFFNLNFILQNKRKVKQDVLKIPIPFDTLVSKNITFFDYRIKTFAKNNKEIENIILNMEKPCINRFYDKILKIEVKNG